MSDTNRTVTVALQLVYDPRSARAFQQMSKEAAKASKAASDEAMKAVSKAAQAFQKGDQRLSRIGGIASNLGAYGFAGNLGRFASQAEGLQQAGFGGSARFLQRAAVPLAIASQGAQAAERVAGYAYDRYSNNGQIARAAFRDLVPGGERIQRFADAMSGRGADFEQADISAQYRAANARGRLEQSQFDLSFNPRLAGLNATAQAYRKGSAVVPGVFDRTSSGGEMAYREAQKLLPLRQAEAKADREMSAASAERLSNEKELVKLANRAADLRRQRDALERQSGMDGGSGADQQNRLKQIQGLTSEIESTASLERQAREGVVSSKGRESMARAEQAKARDRLKLGGEAERLEGRVEIAQGAARRLGGMNQFDRTFGLQMARMIKERGSVDGLPPEMVAAAQSFAPEFIGKIIEKTGAGSAEFKAGFSEFGAADFGTLDIAGDSKKAQELRNRLADSEYGADSRAAQEMAAVAKEFGMQVGNMIKLFVENAKTEILNTIRLGRNAN